MTKKDYILIAKLIREGLERAEAARHDEERTAEFSALWRFADQFALEARRDNPRFDRHRFLFACNFPTWRIDGREAA